MFELYSHQWCNVLLYFEIFLSIICNKLYFYIQCRSVESSADLSFILTVLYLTGGTFFCKWTLYFVPLNFKMASAAKRSAKVVLFIWENSCLTMLVCSKMKFSWSINSPCHNEVQKSIFVCGKLKEDLFTLVTCCDMFKNTFFLEYLWSTIKDSIQQSTMTEMVVW